MVSLWAVVNGEKRPWEHKSSRRMEWAFGLLPLDEEMAARHGGIQFTTHPHPSGTVSDPILCLQIMNCL